MPRRRIIARGTPHRDVRDLQALTAALKEGRPLTEVMGHAATIASGLDVPGLTPIARFVAQRLGRKEVPVERFDSPGSHQSSTNPGAADRDSQGEEVFFK